MNLIKWQRNQKVQLCSPTNFCTTYTPHTFIFFGATVDPSPKLLAYFFRIFRSLPWEPKIIFWLLISNLMDVETHRCNDTTCQLLPS